MFGRAGHCPFSANAIMIFSIENGEMEIGDCKIRRGCWEIPGRAGSQESSSSQDAALGSPERHRLPPGPMVRWSDAGRAGTGKDGRSQPPPRRDACAPPRPPRRRFVSEVDAVFRGSQGESRHSDAGACGQCRPSRHEACGSPREFPDRSKSNQIQPKNRGVRWSGVGRNSPERDSRKCIFTKRTHFAGPSPLEAGLRTLSTGSGLRLGASQVRGIKAFMIYHLGFSIWFQVSSTGAGTHHDGPDCPRYESAAELSCNYLVFR